MDSNKIKEIVQRIEKDKETSYISKKKSAFYEFENKMPQNIGKHINDNKNFDADVKSIRGFAKQLMDGLE